VQQDCLHRVLRAAVNYHCLAVAPGAWGRAARFQNNALSSLLLKDHPAHMSSFVRALPALPRLHHSYHPAAGSAKATALLVLCSCMFKGVCCWYVYLLDGMQARPHVHIASCRGAVRNFAKITAGAPRRGQQLEGVGRHALGG